MRSRHSLRNCQRVATIAHLQRAQARIAVIDALQKATAAAEAVDRARIAREATIGHWQAFVGGSLFTPALLEQFTFKAATDEELVQMTHAKLQTANEVLTRQRFAQAHSEGCYRAASRNMVTATRANSRRRDEATARWLEASGHTRGREQ